MNLILVSVHGDGELEVGWYGSRANSDAILVCDLQMVGDIQGRGEGGCGCQTQQAANPQTVPQHLKAKERTVIVSRGLLIFTALNAIDLLPVTMYLIFYTHIYLPNLIFNEYYSTYRITLCKKYMGVIVNKIALIG